jgi:hypothetical protein
VIDLENGAQKIVAVLLLVFADGKDMVERHVHLALPKGQHLVQLVGVEPDIDAWF